MTEKRLEKRIGNEDLFWTSKLSLQNLKLCNFIFDPSVSYSRESLKVLPAIPAAQCHF